MPMAKLHVGVLQPVLLPGHRGDGPAPDRALRGARPGSRLPCLRGRRGRRSSRPATQARGKAGGAIVSREQHRGIEILRARGTRFSKRRFAGRFSNYVTYFMSACYAGLRLDRPDVVVALTDPPIIGLAAYLAARRFGRPVRHVLPRHLPRGGAAAGGLPERRGEPGAPGGEPVPGPQGGPQRGARRDHAPAPDRGQGRRPGQGAGDPRLGGLLRDRPRQQGQRLRPRPRAHRQVRGHALGQHRPLPGARGRHRGRRPPSPRARHPDGLRRRRRQETRPPGSRPGARADERDVSCPTSPRSG